MSKEKEFKVAYEDDRKKIEVEVCNYGVAVGERTYFLQSYNDWWQEVASIIEEYDHNLVYMEGHYGEGLYRRGDEEEPEFTYGDTAVSVDGDTFEWFELDQFVYLVMVDRFDALREDDLEEIEEVRITYKYMLQFSYYFGANKRLTPIDSTTYEDFLIEVASAGNLFGEDEEVVVVKDDEVVSDNLLYTADDWEVVMVAGEEMVASSDDFTSKPTATTIKAIDTDGNVVYITGECIYEDKYEYKYAMTLRDFGECIRDAWRLMQK